MSAKVLITTGDPAGCGPLITVRAVNKLKNKGLKFYIVGDQAIISKVGGYSRIKNHITFIDLNTPGIEKLKAGYASKLGGQASLNYLKIGLDIMRKEKIKRIVTAPISKEAVQLVDPEFCGHTEYLANHFNISNFAMIMASSLIKAALFTRHIPLSSVRKYIKRKDICATINLVHKTLQKVFKIKSPRIGFAAFNPHGGVDTYLGKEEKTILQAIKDSAKAVTGPIAADTIFTLDNLINFDCIICLYHDQAMIPFKLLSFKDGVNFTAGLPIIRTSPAHGVAYKLIKSGSLPFSSSMEAAIKLASSLSV
ncbi:MAG: hypothetical protein GY858_04430 [Candidatus Omnitrophica bacterium]|nr:hypothetical protein [Candidatus Omnitrophota bacterium]